VAAHPQPHKVRQRSFDRLRQKLWAVPAHLRLRIQQRSAPKPRPRGDGVR
jgi:hypothetical protein